MAAPRHPFFTEQSERHFNWLLERVVQGQTTVIIGAGLSRPAGLPGWEGLAGELAKEAGTPAPTGSASSDIMESIDRACEELGAKCLGVLRGALNPPGLTLPALYERVGKVPFLAFGTLNLDEFLFGLAVGTKAEPDSAIWWYPLKGFIDKRYFYLHGRVSQAKAMSDVVVTSTDYDQAYRELHGESLRALQHLLDYPTVFIGSSLNDPDVYQFIKKSERFRRANASIGGLRGESYAEDTHWYAILPARKDDLVPLAAVDRYSDEELRQIADETARTRYDPLKIIWYEHDDGHAGLEALIGKMLERSLERPSSRPAPFLAIAATLEQLAMLNKPSSDQIEQLAALLLGRANQRHFFQYAAPAWFPILVERNLFPIPLEPVAGGDGRLYAEQWEPEEYLVRCAPGWPEETLSIINRSTENWLALRAFSRALSRLPASHVARAVALVDRWLAVGGGVRGSITLPLLGLIARMIGEEQLDTAMALTGEMARWRRTDGG